LFLIFNSLNKRERRPSAERPVEGAVALWIDEAESQESRRSGLRSRYCACTSGLPVRARCSRCVSPSQALLQAVAPNYSCSRRSKGNDMMAPRG